MSAPSPLPVAASVPSRSSLDPTALARIASLSLRARQVVEGVLSGLHPSAHHGSSVEFAEHKEYSPGDEVRHIDWKLYAKSDKLYVKRFEHETNLRAFLLLDATASMAYGDRGMSKWDYARTAAASLAWLLLDQRDAVGLGILRGGLEAFVPPRSDRGHLQALLHTLESERPEGKGKMAAGLDAVAERIPRRGLVLLFTDAFEELGPLAKALQALRHRNHEVVVFQVLDPDEVELPFDELTRFRSLEDSREVLADPRDIRSAYQAALAAHDEALTLACRGHEIDHTRLVTSEPLDRALVRWLGARERRR